MKYIIILLLLTGCTTIVKEPIFIETKCPRIPVLKPVDRIVKDHNGSLTDDDIRALLDGARQLRKSEEYYIDTLTKYNKKYTKSLDD